MRFKSDENKLMWEMYTTPTSHGSEEEGMAIIEIEPSTDLECSEEPDDYPIEEVDDVLVSDLKKLAEYSQKLLEVCPQQELEPWMKAKIIKASDYVSEIWHRLDATADFANDGYEQSDNIDL